MLIPYRLNASRQGQGILCLSYDVQKSNRRLIFRITSKAVGGGRPAICKLKGAAWTDCSL